MKHFFVILTIVCFTLAAFAQKPKSLELSDTYWFNQEKTAVIQIIKENSLYNGKIVWLKNPLRNGKPSLDKENPDPALKTKPILGLELLKGFQYSGKNVWKKGTIYDPDNGKTYQCTIKANKDGTLAIRGFIGHPLVGRTTIWTSVPQSIMEKFKEKSNAK